MIAARALDVPARTGSDDPAPQRGRADDRQRQDHPDAWHGGGSGYFTEDGRALK